MLLKEASKNKARKSGPTVARGAVSKKTGVGKSSRKMPLVVGLSVIIILAAMFGAFYYFYYYGPNQVVQNWEIHIHFFDYRYGINYTLPIDIGVSGGLWTNHTLDQYGPTGYAPLSTRDATGTIYLRSKVFELYTFQDFFNIWGQPFDEFCVPMPPLYTANNPYCTGPGETVVYDPTLNATVDSHTQILYTSPLSLLPAIGTPLSTDSHFKYIDSDNNSKFDPGETVVYDNQNTGSLLSTDWIVNSTQGASPSIGTPIRNDPTLRFIDTTGSGVWVSPRPPPVMSDGTNDLCISPGYALSNNKDWLVLLYTAAASGINGNCQA